MSVASSRLPGALDLIVADVLERTGRVRSLSLRRADGGCLPGYVAGSHIVVECGDAANAYSLTGDGRRPTEYAISVRLAPEGRGGSRALHRLTPGETVRVSHPRSAFPPIAAARRHLLVAGGIGVTAILSHARAAAAWGRPATVLYAHRAGAGAHREDLARLARNGTIELTECLGRDRLRAELGRQLTESRLGTHLYACGPDELMAEVATAARAAGWPDGRLHAESFGAAALDPGEPFVARLADGERVEVPAGTSLLEALHSAGRDVPSLCRQGVCGQCRVEVTSGRPLHRDHFLSAEERALGRSMMACVSRSHDPELELSR